MPYFSYLQINLGLVTLYTWGLFLGLAFFVCFFLFSKKAAKKNLTQEKIFWLAIFILSAGIVSARLFYVIQFPYYLYHPLKILEFSSGGLTIYGGLLGGLIAGWLYVKKSKLDFWQLADILAPIIALGIFIVRIGCFFTNDHQGSITGLPWAIQWPDGELRHPVALYLSLNGLFMFWALLFLKDKLKRSGQLFIIFLLYYSISRFILDFFRSSNTLLSDPHYLSLTVSQWISIFTLLALVIFGKKLLAKK